LNLNDLNLRNENTDRDLDKSPGDYLHKNTYEENGITYYVKKKEKSSKAVFSITAEKDGEILWNLPLGFEDITWWDGPVLVLADQNLVTFGKKFTSDNKGYVVGVDKNSGLLKI
jgi:hypothetical protein